MTRELEQFVWSRAGDLCEYCLLPQQWHPWRFEIDHIISQSHGGVTIAENLALCCPKCNRHKGTNLSGFDFDTSAVTRLFTPRSDRWSDHFKWNFAILAGVTSIGRVTLAVLHINDAPRVAVRQALIDEGVFPAK